MKISKTMLAQFNRLAISIFKTARIVQNLNVKYHLTSNLTGYFKRTFTAHIGAGNACANHHHSKLALQSNFNQAANDNVKRANKKEKLENEDEEITEKVIQFPHIN